MQTVHQTMALFKGCIQVRLLVSTSWIMLMAAMFCNNIILSFLIAHRVTVNTGSKQKKRQKLCNMNRVTRQ